MKSKLTNSETPIILEANDEDFSDSYYSESANVNEIRVKASSKFNY